MLQVNSSYDYIMQTDWCLLQTFFSSSHSIYIAASLKKDSSNLHIYWYDLHPFQIVLRPQIGEFCFQIPWLLFGFHGYVAIVNPAQQKPFSAIFFSDKIPFIWVLWFSPGQWGRAGGKEKKTKQNRVVEGVFLEFSSDSYFISADMRSLTQTPLHQICTNSNKIQTGRLQHILSDKCIFQFLWKQQYYSDVLGLVFQGTMLNSLVPELHCITERGLFHAICAEFM